MLAALTRLALGRRLPPYSGVRRVQRVSQRVEIYRDDYAIPHIFADNESDAWFGLGFCQAQDRSFQMEFLNRLAKGTLCEWLGPRTLDMDRIARRLELATVARESLALCEPDIRAILESFSAGVNEGRASGLKRVPHEYAILKAKPGEHRPEDTLVMLYLMSLLIPNNWDMELARLRIAHLDGVDALRAIDPSFSGRNMDAPPLQRAVEKLEKDLNRLAELAGGFPGSNNWVISASRSQTGRPWLANDPHLYPFIPPYWYLSHVKTPQFEALGASLSGSPGYIIGHNETGAWGVTAGIVDNSDFFIEEIESGGARGPKGREKVISRQEVFAVRGKSPVKENVLKTARGPILSDVIDGTPVALSFCAAWLTPRRVRGILGIHHAKNFDDFRKCFDGWAGLSLNYCYADSSGKIGWQLVGQPALRNQGGGAAPKAAWDADCQWGDLVPFAKMPWIENPKEGFFATANNRPVHDEREVFLGIDWLEPFRYYRIVEMLAESKDWTSEKIRKLQVDTFSIPWREMKEGVLRDLRESKDDKVRDWAGRLADWDGRLEAGSREATVFGLFQIELIRELVKSKTPRAFEIAMGKGFQLGLNPHNWMNYRRTSWLLGLLERRPPGWLEKDWATTIQDALRSVIDRFPEGVPAWGDYRSLRLIHPLGRVPALGKIFNRGPVPYGGDSNTVAQSGVDILSPQTNPTSVAGLRTAIDVGAWENSKFVLAGGQSGNPFSPHYDDLFALWQRGEGINFWKKRGDLAACPRWELVPL